MIVLATSSRALWYLTRGSGAVTLILLTISLLLGILELHRWTPGGTPRFMVAALHRSTSLLVLVLLAVHIATAVLDTFAPIRLLDAVVPFAGSYRPLWLGLGALAFDLLLALIVTSLVRRRLGLRAWRFVHWAAYACWPVAVAHGLGTGSDAPATWLIAVTAVCAAAVVTAVAWRLRRGWPADRRIRVAGAIATAAFVLIAVAWARQGPLAHGWASRAGTPATLLAVRPTARAVATTTPTPAVARAVTDALAAGFSGTLRGTLHRGSSSGGSAVVDLALRSAGTRIRVRLGGLHAPGGGLYLRRSAVALGPAGHPRRYTGRVTRLDGQGLQALVGTPGGRALQLTLVLQIDGNRIGGSAAARPVTGRAG